jgi:hypothetical protein
MKPTLNAMLAIVFISSFALAQSPGLSGWIISDIQTSPQKEIQGMAPAGSKGEIKETRTAKKGQFIELRECLISPPPPVPSLPIGSFGIKLSGVSEKGEVLQ